MADKKISALTGAATPLAGTEVLPIVQSGTTVKVSVASLTAGRSPTMNYAITNNGVIIQNGGVNRWFLEREVGASDDFFIYRYNNDGSYAGNPVQISRSTGNFRLEGNLTQGTAAKGVNFTANTPATGMTSQLLNNYEEGTWTPTDASGAGLTLTTTTATYTRIGRLVTAILYTAYPATANASDAYIGGLPFTALAGPLVAGIVTVGYAPAAPTLQGGYVVQNDKKMQLLKTTAGGITNAGLSGSDLMLLITYTV